MATGYVGILDNIVRQLSAERTQRLLAVSQKYLDLITPMPPIRVVEALEAYNKGVAEEISRFGTELKTEIIRASTADGVAPEASLKQQTMSVVDEYLQPALYTERFTVFMEAIERKLKSFGVRIDWSQYRTDLPKSLSRAHSENRCRAIRAEIGTELDLLILNQPPTEDIGTETRENWYQSLKKFYADHQLAFWVVGFLLSIAGVMLA